MINQLDHFWDGKSEKTTENIAASFQRAAVGMIVKRLERALADTGIRRVLAGGGVAANSRLRKELNELEGIEVYFPSLPLCTDNGAMIAGLAYHYLTRGDRSGLDLNAYPRVEGFRKTYP